MSVDWKPGDVLTAVVNGQRMLVLRGRGIFEGNYYTQGPVAGSRLAVSGSWLTDARPLVVIDPEDREQVVRLLAATLCQHDPLHPDGSGLADALREFANPAPPKPDEPTGLGAVVEDAGGERWVRVTVKNESYPDEVWEDRFGNHRWTKWDNIAADDLLPDTEDDLEVFAGEYGEPTPAEQHLMAQMAAHWARVDLTDAAIAAWIEGADQ